jgi:hypothetical protein
MDTPASPRHKGARVLLGLFILWQLFFLVVANLIDPLKEELPRHLSKLPPRIKEVVEVVAPGLIEKKGQLYDSFEVVTNVTKRWGQTTGQVQSWSLFAPDVTSEITFVAVELRWDVDPLSAPVLARRLLPLAATDGFSGVLLWAEAVRGPVLPFETEVACRRLTPLAGSNSLEVLSLWMAAAASPALTPGERELLLSDNEPRNVEHFSRWGHFRLRKFEGYLDVVLAPKAKETNEARVERWQDEIDTKVRKEWNTIEMYLQWRLDGYRKQHPQKKTPRQVILLVRRYAVASPQDYEEARKNGAPLKIWSAPYTVPLARWQPGLIWDANYRPIETYNLANNAFESRLK